jgi:hypothetical protein
VPGTAYAPVLAVRAMMVQIGSTEVLTLL